MRIGGSIRLRRIAFWIYACTLFAATHWPALELHVPRVRRPDLVIHASSFCLWYLLLFFAAYFGRQRLIGPWLVAVVYAAVDESLQLIPAIRRHAAWDDLAANAAGITIGLIFAWILTRIRAGSRVPGSAGEQSAA